MNLASAKPGDIVLVERRGMQYYGEVQVKLTRALLLRPLSTRLAQLPTYHRCTSREVIGLWHKSRQGQRASSQEVSADA